MDKELFIMRGSRKYLNKCNTAHNMGYSDRCRLSRQLQTAITVADCQCRCRLPRLFQTVKKTADSFKLSRQLKIVNDQYQHDFSGLFSESISYVLKDGAMTRIWKYMKQKIL